MNTYQLEFRVYGHLVLDQRVIDAVDDEWRDMFYDLPTPDDIAHHVGYNLMKGRRLSNMDGFADMPDEWARINYTEWDW